MLYCGRGAGICIPIYRAFGPSRAPAWEGAAARRLPTKALGCSVSKANLTNGRCGPSRPRSDAAMPGMRPTFDEALDLEGARAVRLEAAADSLRSR